MKFDAKGIIFALIFGSIMPLVMCMLLVPPLQKNPLDEEIHLTVSQTESQQAVILVQTDEGQTEMPLTDYIVGVILGEMPESFLMEAKKAQAVVARTYALRVADGDRHNGAVCTDAGCCQSFCDPLKAAGTEREEQARIAALQTEGMVLTYRGELIDATYFSCSGGMTEDAVAVWGTDIPYLQAVESPGEENAVHYTDTVTFSLQSFQEALQRELPEDTSKWLGAITYTQGSSINTMEIGGEIWLGTELRKALGLRSTAFEIELVGNSVIITTKGFGHRVGMSQYGANAMARGGYSFQDILHHYYQGVVLEENWV